MANDQIDLMLPDGTPVSIPAWAQEATMRSISSSVRSISRLEARLLSVMGENNDDIKQILEDTTQAAESDAKSNSEDTVQKRKLTRSTKRAYQNIQDAGGFLKNTEAPISSFVGAVKEGGEGLAKALGSGNNSLFSKLGNKIVELEYKIRVLECEIMHYEYDIDTGISCEETALED